jgi:hypothetical protein
MHLLTKSHLWNLNKHKESLRQQSRHADAFNLALLQMWISARDRTGALL